MLEIMHWIKLRGSASIGYSSTTVTCYASFDARGILTTVVLQVAMIHLWTQPRAVVNHDTLHLSRVQRECEALHNVL